MLSTLSDSTPPSTPVACTASPWCSSFTSTSSPPTSSPAVVAEGWKVDTTVIAYRAQGDAPSGRMLPGHALIGGRLYIFGGHCGDHICSQSILHEFDFATLTWSQSVLSESPSDRIYFRYATFGTSVYVFGGIYPYDSTSLSICTNPTSCWSSQGKPESFVCQAVKAWYFTFQVTGLNIAGEILSDAYVLDLASRSWRLLIATLTPWTDRLLFSVTAVGELFYIFGGHSSPGVFFDDFFVFNISDLHLVNISDSVIGLPTARSLVATTTIEKRIFLLGGFAGVGLGDLHVYDTIDAKWTDLTKFMTGTFPSPGVGTALTAVDGRIFTYGGYSVEAVAFSGKLHQFDPSPTSMLWTDITAYVDETTTSNRAAHIFIYYEGKFVLFGGLGFVQFNIGFFGDLRVLYAPRVLNWPSGRSIFAFVWANAWDTFVLGDEEVLLVGHIDLCKLFFPCALHAVGTSKNSVIVQQHPGSLTCDAAAGCLGIFMDSISIRCRGDTLMVPIIIIQGSQLSLKNISFSDCSSTADGAAIQALPGSQVFIRSSKFSNLRTTGYGAALSVMGSSTRLVNSQFTHCTAKGGGAIWNSIFQCYGNTILFGSDIAIESCWFHHCRSEDDGGAILSISEASDVLLNMSLVVKNCTFSNCSAAAEGGALCIDGSSVRAEVSESHFELCTSVGSGGAISVQNGAKMSLTEVFILQNSAEGQGGGGLSVRSASILADNVSFINNSAPLGGGGALFWSAPFVPVSLQGLNCLGNQARYGPCLASDYKNLEVLWKSGQSEYAGIPFDVNVLKRDFYNQIILADSKSVLQVFPGRTGNLDPFTFILGNFVGKFENGQASFRISVKPTFSWISYTNQLTELISQPSIFFSGYDALSDTGTLMESKTVEVMLMNGSTVCPAGYVLRLDDESHLGGPAACTYCRPGQYSLNPLAPADSMIIVAPQCLNCPAGGLCNDGGSLVRFPIGIWVMDHDKYLLRSCPEGFQLVNSSAGVFVHDLQKCDACLPAYYAVDSTKCSRCPAGYFCVGGSSPRTPCPSGYFSPSMSNSSSACYTAVFLVASVRLTNILREEFVRLESRFMTAMASAAGIDPERLSVVDVSRVGRRQLNVSSVLLVQCQISCDDASMANSVMATLLSSADTLGEKLAANGVPVGVLESVRLARGAGSDSSTPVAVIAGAASAAAVLFVVCSGFGLYFWARLREQLDLRALTLAMREAQPGDQAKPSFLPRKLRKVLVAERVLGRGAFGCVIQARRKNDDGQAAVKILLPSSGGFTDREQRQLRRERKVLEMFTAEKCEHAVHVSGVGGCEIFPHVSWFVMEMLDGEDLEAVLKRGSLLTDLQCIRVGRNVLAALKVMHRDGIVHRDIKPANIMRCAAGRPRGPPAAADHKDADEASFTYKLIDFGTALGVDEKLAKETMRTLTGNRQLGAGTPPYMSPEMFKDPETASYPTDLWSLGVSLFELATGRLPFQAESDLLWSYAVAGDMDERAPSVLDRLAEDSRSAFDHNLARVVERALEKRVSERFQSVDEMHEAVYGCLIHRGEAFYSVFVSYRVASEAPLARLLFDELNHTVTAGGHRVTVYWDAYRLVKGEDWVEGFTTGLLNSLCIFPLFSYGATAPLAPLAPDQRDAALAKGWEDRPLGRARLTGGEADQEDSVLKEFLIASALLDRRSERARSAPPLPSPPPAAAATPIREEVGRADGNGGSERGMLQLAYPVLVGRPHPTGHAGYPGMGSFFDVQAGGGQYLEGPSPATSRAVGTFLRERARWSADAAAAVERRGVAAVVQGLLALQGCRLWEGPSTAEAGLSKEQLALVGKGYAGPPVDLDPAGPALTDKQRRLCGAGWDEAQLRMLKAQVRARLGDFHEIIDRAVHLAGLAASSSRRPVESQPSGGVEVALVYGPAPAGASPAPPAPTPLSPPPEIAAELNRGVGAAPAQLARARTAAAAAAAVPTADGARQGAGGAAGSAPRVEQALVPSAAATTTQYHSEAPRAFFDLDGPTPRAAVVGKLPAAVAMGEGGEPNGTKK